MKKKALIMSACLCLVLSLSACGKKSESNSEATVTPSVTEGEQEATKSDVSVTLGQYKGIEVTMQSTEVTDEEVQQRVDSFNETYGTPIKVTDRTDVQDGDTVNINYVGKIDGVAFEGGTADNSPLTIGSGQFIDGFESGLVGKNVGETVDVTCTFPADYKNADVAGKEAVFTVTINFIDSGKKEPLTDEVVAANDTNGSKTIAEYEEYIRTNLKSTKESNAKTQKEIDIVTKAIENATFEGILQEEYDEYETYLKTNYETAATQYGIDLETFVYFFFGGMSLDDFNTELKSAAEFNVHQKYLLQEVVKAEELAITDEEYETKLAEYMEDYGYTDKDKFVTDVGGKDYIEQSALLDKAMDLILTSAVVTE